MNKPLELVEWEDSCSLSGHRGWRDLSEAEDMEPIKILSVGWAVKETDDYIVLISQNGDQQVDGEICILKCCIRQRRVLGIKE